MMVGGRCWEKKTWRVGTRVGVGEPRSACRLR